ncbi:oxygenase-like protein [Coccomyxa subellipsoidea C-169]|uniref:Oxygenase-like protein n=1 Tax=Coccomyxa subellipsoidea (strain C-169) TaxID=574566 RepID=I0Z511_COCSC|nr:oxygenase-like protein [Coccomyxa subellipsoidea C-169]EIE25730.1 oxygenase-like protein [Coccomyxa subellipsoidea C-169]|eukprot:XP_005650274.1 oxygenase-like protein [Coccomyxa subellipsoidea C-169]
MSLQEDVLAAQLRKACIDTGFFYVFNHGVAQDLIEQIFEENRKFFALPEAARREILVDKNNRGWTPLSEETLDRANQTEGDTKEGLYFGREVPADSTEAAQPFTGPNQWPSPELLPEYRRVTNTYFSAVTDLGMRMLRLLALALGLAPDYFLPMFGRPMLFLRPLHYIPRRSQPDQGIFAAGAHSDYGMLTLLATDDAPGLQIWLPSAGRFVDVPPKPGAFIVNLGDMLERWTNGLFKSTLHRVVTDGSRHRYSIPFFFEPNFDTRVECLPCCCGPDNPPRYPPTTSGQHLLDKYAQTHAGFDATSKTSSAVTAGAHADV